MTNAIVIERCLAAEERLRNPVLQMLSRKLDAPFCISLIQTIFTTQTATVPLSEFYAQTEACLRMFEKSEAISVPVWCYDSYSQDDQAEVAADRILSKLSRPLKSDGYGWLKQERDEETLEESVRISSEGLDALALYENLGQDERSFTSVKADDFNVLLNNLIERMELDPTKRIESLNARIEKLQAQVDQIRESGVVDPITPLELTEQLQHAYDIVMKMPSAIRRVRESEEATIKKIVLDYRTTDMSGARLLEVYENSLVDRFEKSDDGRSYNAAMQALNGDLGLTKIDKAHTLTETTGAATADTSALISRIQDKLSDVLVEIDGVASAFNDGTQMCARLAKPRHGAKWQQESNDLQNAIVLFREYTSQTKGRNPLFPVVLSYGQDKIARLYPYEKELTFTHTKPLPLVKPEETPDFDSAALIKRAFKIGPCDVRNVAALLIKTPVYDKQGTVDLAGTFNSFSQDDRLPQSMAGLFSEFGQGGGTLDREWIAYDIDGNPHRYLSPQLSVPEERLQEVAEQRKE